MRAIHCLNTVLGLGVILGASACGSRQARITAGGATNRPAVDAPTSLPAAAPSTPGSRRDIVFEPVRIDVVTRGGGGAEEARSYDALALLEEGNAALIERRYDEALAAFDHLVADFPDSQLVPAALYNAGLAFEGKGEYLSAADRYRMVTSRAAAGSQDGIDAAFRLGAVLAEAEHYAEAVPVFEELLDRKELEPAARIEALARLGYVLVALKDYAGAELILRSALKYHRDIELTHPFDSRYYVAMCQYYLADIPRRQFAEIPLRLPEEQLSRDIEQKSELFLLARDRYMKTIDFKDRYWATASVYQIGVTYRQFWDQFMALPIPPELEPEAAKLYVETVNQEPQLRRLLEKSLLYHERNVAMARDARDATVWSDGSAAEAEAVRQLLARQQRGELITPGTVPGKVETLAPGRPDAGTSAGGGLADYIPERPNL